MKVVLALLGLAIVAVSAMLWWPRDAAPAPMSPSSTREETAAIAPAATATRGTASEIADEAVNEPAPMRRAVVDAPPGIEDFAPEQRAAVRELLEDSRPSPEEVAEIEATIAAAEPDSFTRQVLELACLPGAAIVRCAVFAVREGSIEVKLQSRAPELMAEVGSRLVLTRAVPREQAGVLVRHGLPPRASVEAGHVHALLLMRHPLAPGVGVICLCASPALGLADAADGGGVADEATLLLDFPIAERAVVRELLSGRSPMWFREGDGSKTHGKVALVRCSAEPGMFGGHHWRALNSQPALTIDAGDGFGDLSILPAVRSHYGLRAVTDAAVGEVRTLVVGRILLLGFPYKLFILLESPPLKQ